MACCGELKKEKEEITAILHDYKIFVAKPP